MSAEPSLFCVADAAVGFTADPVLMDEWNHGLDAYLTHLDRGTTQPLTALPYDGCGLCDAREAMAYLIPRVLAAVRDGLIEVAE